MLIIRQELNLAVVLISNTSLVRNANEFMKGGMETMTNKALTLKPTVRQGKVGTGNFTITKQILYSSLYGMMHDCPTGHATKGYPCPATNHEGMTETIVCAERRALEPITKPGQYVTVKFTRDGVRVV